MENMLYLLNIRVSGIKNIKNEVRLDFYKKTVDKDFDPDKYRIKAVYGENGCGKSALVTAIKIFQDLLISDNYLSESKTQLFLDEIINRSTGTFRFDCEFLAHADTFNIVYAYSVCIAKSDNGVYEILSETLKRKNGNYVNNKYKKIFESKDGDLSYISCSADKRAILEKMTMNLLSTHSFLSIFLTNLKKDAASFNETLGRQDLFLDMLMFFTLAIMIRVYLAEEDQHELYLLRRKSIEGRADGRILQEQMFGYRDLANIFSSVNEKSVAKDDFEGYRDKIHQLTRFIQIFKPDLVSIDIDAKENGDRYECTLDLNYGDYRINREFESTGIKKLIRLFDCFALASTMGIVFVDEMDSNLNDVYLCKLIEYFMYYGKGQLCFTTHNLDPMSILKENKNSIDFLSSDGHLVPWTSRGNASPENQYKNGMIEDLPFNIDATDFVGIFGE